MKSGDLDAYRLSRYSRLCSRYFLTRSRPLWAVISRICSRSPRKWNLVTQFSSGGGDGDIDRADRFFFGAAARSGDAGDRQGNVGAASGPHPDRHRLGGLPADRPVAVEQLRRNARGIRSSGGWHRRRRRRADRRNCPGVSVILPQISPPVQDSATASWRWLSSEQFADDHLHAVPVVAVNRIAEHGVDRLAGGVEQAPGVVGLLVADGKA